MPSEQKPPPLSAAEKRRRIREARKALEPETPLVDEMAKRSPRVSTGMKPPGGKKGYEQDDRAQRTVRLGKRWSEIYQAVKVGEYTWAEFCDGLDEEELARGQLKAADGTFTGRPPSFVPREFLLACQREQKRRFEEIFGSEVLGMAKTYIQLCKDASIPAKDRAKLLQYAMERVFGGIPKDVRVSQEQPYEQMLVNVVSEDGDGMPDHLRRRYDTYAERRGEGLPE